MTYDDDDEDYYPYDDSYDPYEQSDEPVCPNCESRDIKIVVEGDWNTLMHTWELDWSSAINICRNCGETFQ